MPRVISSRPMVRRGFMKMKSSGSTLNSRFPLDVVAQRVEVFLDLGHTQDFLNGGLCSPDLVPAVDAQCAHPLFDGFLGDSRSRRAIQNQRSQRLVQNQQFVDAFPALVAELAALFASRAVP